MLAKRLLIGLPFPNRHRNCFALYISQQGRVSRSFSSWIEMSSEASAPSAAIRCEDCEVFVSKILCQACLARIQRETDRALDQLLEIRRQEKNKGKAERKRAQKHKLIRERTALLGYVPPSL